MTTNIVTAKFCNSRRTTTRPLTQYDYGQILRIEGIDLPDAYEVDFSNNQYTGDSKPQLGDASGVAIPEEYIKTGKDIYAFIYLHAGESDGETFYWIKIPNKLRPARTEETPTPEEQSIIDQTIAALNTSVQKVEDIADRLEEQIDTALQEAKDSGEFDGEDGFSPEITIESIAGGHHITIVDAEGSSSFDVMNGVDGEDGKGIVSVEKTGTAGLVDTYTITYTDGTTTTFTVTNGKDGIDGKDGKDGIDGISPTATVSQTSTGVRITIIDKNGTTTADVNNGTNGATFTPNVSSEGIISWTNNAGLPNPESRNIRGPRGEPGTGVSVHICSSSEYDPTTRVPTIQDPDENTFYLVPAESAASPNMFVEWIFTNNAWEMFGNATVEVPVQDVQVNGTSILGQDGVANVPLADTTNPGAVIIGNGLTLNSSNKLAVSPATTSTVKQGTNTSQPIVPDRQHTATFYGLAKAAGDSTQAASSNPVGTYTDNAKTAIKTMLGVTDPTVTDVQVNGVSVLSGGVANVPIGSASTPGVFTAGVLNNRYGITVRADGSLQIVKAEHDAVKKSQSFQICAYQPIVPYTQHESIYYGLSKLAGADMTYVTGETVGVYPEVQKSAISQMLNGSVAVTGTTPSITALPGIRYVCGEVATLSFTPSATGICDVVFTSGSTATVLTVPNTVKWPAWFNPASLETNATYEINVLDGVYGAVGIWI